MKAETRIVRTLLLACPTCGAAPGEHCRRRALRQQHSDQPWRGDELAHMHSGRYDAEHATAVAR